VTDAPAADDNRAPTDLRDEDGEVQAINGEMVRRWFDARSLERSDRIDIRRRPQRRDRNQRRDGGGGDGIGDDARGNDEDDEEDDEEEDDNDRSRAVWVSNGAVSS
jgi:hypothetical protein